MLRLMQSVIIVNQNNGNKMIRMIVSRNIGGGGI